MESPHFNSCCTCTHFPHHSQAAPPQLPAKCFDFTLWFESLHFCQFKSQLLFLTGWNWQASWCTHQCWRTKQSCCQFFCKVWRAKRTLVGVTARLAFIASHDKWCNRHTNKWEARKSAPVSGNPWIRLSMTLCKSLIFVLLGESFVVHLGTPHAKWKASWLSPNDDKMIVWLDQTNTTTTNDPAFTPATGGLRTPLRTFTGNRAQTNRARWESSKFDWVMVDWWGSGRVAMDEFGEKRGAVSSQRPDGEQGLSVTICALHHKKCKNLIWRGVKKGMTVTMACFRMSNVPYSFFISTDIFYYCSFVKENYSVGNYSTYCTALLYCKQRAFFSQVNRRWIEKHHSYWLSPRLLVSSTPYSFNINHSDIRACPYKESIGNW